MNNATWFIGNEESDKTIYASMETSKILNNYPHYRHLFQELKMPEVCALVGLIEDLSKSLNQLFSFEVEYVTPGTLVDLNAQDKTMYMYRYYHGHIYPKAQDGEALLKIEAVDEKARYVDLPKALYEYGQMISHQVKLSEAESGNYFHNTAAYYAALLMGYDETEGDTEENVWALAFGNQLSGWMNAMWLAWILGIDQQALIMAMVMLEIDEMEDEEPPEFAQYIWLKYKRFALDRKFANEHFSRVGPYSLDDFVNGKQLYEVALSQQIDHASALLFQIMILDENFRVAEEQYKSMDRGLCLSH